VKKCHQVLLGNLMEKKKERKKDYSSSVAYFSCIWKKASFFSTEIYYHSSSCLKGLSGWSIHNGRLGMTR